MSIQAMSWVLTESKATLASRLVILAIANHADPQGVSSWPSIPLLSRETRITSRQVQRCIAQLEQSGELAIHRGMGPGRTHLFVLAKMSRAKCWYCGIDEPFLSRLTLDHQIPRSRGGTSDCDNLVYACAPCNVDKSARTVEEYRQRFAPFHAFFGETDESRQFVTFPGRSMVTFASKKGDKRVKQG
jgi:5-methylcytosine-specific restriction endonuclease McrA